MSARDRMSAGPDWTVPNAVRIPRRNPNQYILPFDEGYTYGDLLALRLPRIQHQSSSSHTAPYTDIDSSQYAPDFVLEDANLANDFIAWFEDLLDHTVDYEPCTPQNPGRTIRDLRTPAACHYLWQLIDIPALVPCTSEEWVSVYASHVMNLIGCLVNGLWNRLWISEWDVSMEYSQKGDRHIVAAERYVPSMPPTTLRADVGIAAEWKTETVLAHHLPGMAGDILLPRGKAVQGQAILKKLGLHIRSTMTQCEERNRDFFGVTDPGLIVQYGIVFTGQTCVLSQG
ncbi:hypothetical protein FB45DRAFT_1056906, partial [Roridomyces roridus]